MLIHKFFFQLPEEPDEWLSEDDLLGNKKVICPQNLVDEESLTEDVILGQEDCLVLDVYVRKVTYIAKFHRTSLLLGDYWDTAWILFLSIINLADNYTPSFY